MSKKDIKAIIKDLKAMLANFVINYMENRL